MSNNNINCERNKKEELNTRIKKEELYMKIKKKELNTRIKNIKNNINQLRDIVFMKTNEINGNKYEIPMPLLYNKITMLNNEQDKKKIFTNRLLKRLKQRKNTTNTYTTNNNIIIMENDKYKIIEEEIVFPSY